MKHILGNNNNIGIVKSYVMLEKDVLLENINRRVRTYYLILETNVLVKHDNNNGVGHSYVTLEKSVFVYNHHTIGVRTSLT